MKIRDIAQQFHLDPDAFSAFVSRSSVIKTNLLKTAIDDDDVELAVASFKRYLTKLEEVKREKAAANQARAEEEADRRRAIASMLVTSGFNFDGYTITRYSGYISGDDVISIPKEKGFFTGLNKTNAGEELSKALVRLRTNALRELKEAAYDLGCNAVIGVDFDYITLDPEVHNGVGAQQYTQDLPYVFCVTANGNAVIIEKNGTERL